MLSILLVLVDLICLPSFVCVQYVRLLETFTCLDFN